MVERLVENGSLIMSDKHSAPTMLGYMFRPERVHAMYNMCLVSLTLMVLWITTDVTKHLFGWEKLVG